MKGCQVSVGKTVRFTWRWASNHPCHTVVSQFDLGTC